MPEAIVQTETVSGNTAERSGSIEQVRSVCSLGAIGSVLAIPRAIPITHCGPGCGNKQIGSLIGANGHQGGEISFPSTNATEHEVIFGGTGRLQELIESTLRIVDADLFVVLTGCVSDLIGDDVAGVVGVFQDQGVPIVYAETGGFRGNNLIGHEVVVRAIVDQFVGDYDGGRETGTVNVWSLLPWFNTFWRGDLEEIRRLLEGIGLRVNILFGPDSGGVAEWKSIPKAQFNLVLSPWLGVATARHLEEKYGQPFLHVPVLPIGAAATAAFLRRVVDFSGLDSEKAEAFIAREEEHYYRYLEHFAIFYASTQHRLPSKFVTVGDSAYALAVTDFAVSQLGLVPTLQIVTDNPPGEFREAIRARFEAIATDLSFDVRFLEDGHLIHQAIRGADLGVKKPFLFGTSWELELAAELGAILLEVSFPANDEVVLTQSYLGYRGALRLVETLYTSAIRPKVVPPSVHPPLNR